MSPPSRLARSFDNAAIWSRDGSDLCGRPRDPRFGFYKKPINGSGSEELVWRAPAGTASSTATSRRTGRQTAATSSSRWRARTPAGIFGCCPCPEIAKPVAVDSDGRPTTPRGNFLPDGRWVAYTSNESSQLQVFVQSLPPTGSEDGRCRSPVACCPCGAATAGSCSSSSPEPDA